MKFRVGQLIWNPEYTNYNYLITGFSNGCYELLDRRALDFDMDYRFEIYSAAFEDDSEL